MCLSVFLLGCFFWGFLHIRLKLWGGYLWFEGYVVRTVGVVTSVKIEEYINRFLLEMLAVGATSNSLIC